MNNIIKLLLNIFIFITYFNSFSQILNTVQVFDSTKVCDGYILWMGESNCSLIDRKGNTLFNFPGNLVAFINSKEEIASHSNNNLIVFDKNFDVMWRVNQGIHHELTVTHNDNILLLSDEYKSINNIRVKFDVVFCFDSTGKELYKWSTYDQRSYLLSYLMKDTNIFRYKVRNTSDPDSILFYMAPSLQLIATESFSFRELFHMNAIQEIPENESEKKDSVFQKGNLLLSFCNYSDSLSSFIAIVDPVHNKILWHYVLKDSKQMHTPAMLPNGHILIYVNPRKNKKSDHSLIEEIDPITKDIVWSYTEKFPKVQIRTAFGSCQRLSNGNTFISNNNGYIYEVTPDKKIVWQCLTNASKYLYRAYLYPKEGLKWLINDE